MTQTTDNFLKNLSKILFIAHLVIVLIIRFLTENPQGLLEFLGVVAYIAGNQTLVLISFFLLLYKKINKIGTSIFIAFQVFASVGIYCALFIDTIPVLGIIIGVLSNTLYIVSMVSLLYYNNEKSTQSRQIKNEVVSTTNTPNNSHNRVQYCRKCGNKLVENSKFCNVCGLRIDWN